MSATLKDVAELAGVSIKTVSNVINGYAYVTPETRARVEAALSRVDYRPNITARNLRRGNTGIIALALPLIENPYFAELAHMIVKRAELQALTVLIDCTDGIQERELLAAEGFRTKLIDGLILCPWQLTSDDIAQRKSETPLVLLGERLIGVAESIAIDSRSAARAATEHLITLGRRKIGMIGGVPGAAGVKVPQLREEGYRQALEASGLPYNERLVQHPSSLSASDVAEATERILTDDAIDGLFCFNDLLALGAMRHLASRDFNVPNDIAVVGVDDILAGRLSTPSLSTISQDKALMAQAAVDSLVRQINSPDRARHTQHFDIPFELIARESTSPRRQS